MVCPIMEGAETGKILLTAEVNQSTKLIIALWIMPMLMLTTMIELNFMVNKKTIVLNGQQKTLPKSI